MGLQRDCTRILGLEGYRVERIAWGAEGPRSRMRISIERRGIRSYECSGCRRRTWRVRDTKERTWDDLPWAEHPVTLVYQQRRVACRTCGIRTDKSAHAARAEPEVGAGVFRAGAKRDRGSWESARNQVGGSLSSL
jgi:transposase